MDYLKSPKVLFLSAIFILLSIILGINSAWGGWATPVRISEPAAGYYPQIIAQGDTLHVIYVNDYVHSKACYLRSTDCGQSWSLRKVLTDTVSTGSPWFPQIIRNENWLMALYQIYIAHQVYNYNIGYSISIDNGLTWSAQRYVFSSNVEDPFQFAASASGPLVNIMTQYAFGDSAFYSNIRSANFGQTWSAPIPVFSEIQSNIPDQVSFGNKVHFAWGGGLTSIII
jgi:hypothetical protein